MMQEYLKYSGLAFQMIAVILVGLWAGQKIDQWAQTRAPVFTIAGVLVAIIGSLILIIVKASKFK